MKKRMCSRQVGKMFQVSNVRFAPLVFFILCLLAGLPSAFGQYAGYKAVTDLPAFKKQFASESAKVLSITSDFTQDKILTALTETISSTGKFSFKRSNKVRIEYQKPFVYLMIMNG